MAFVITFITIPSIVNITILKNLCSKPNGRTSHSNVTPTFGGIAVFTGFVITTTVLAGAYFTFELQYIVSSLIIVLFMGIKDDILMINPSKKLAGQILATLIISGLADIRITSLNGLFGINQLPYIASIILTILVLLVIINAFNLIDGIDGLASGIGVLTSSVFGIWFWMTGNIAYTILCFSFTGSLFAFFIFNVFSKKNKIFLGDTGSLVVGLLIGILACRFLQNELNVTGITDIKSSPAVAFGILIVPLFDTLRVFTLRIIQGKSPFIADRQHIHHRLLQLGISHLHATLILVFVNIFFITLCYLLQGIGIIELLSLVLGMATLMSYILMILIKRGNKQQINTQYAEYRALKRKLKKRRIIEIQQIESSSPNPSIVNRNIPK